MRATIAVPAVTAWVALVGVGVWWQARIDSTPGAIAATPANWPEDCDLPRTAGKAMVVIALHPRCPCSRATLGELETVLAAKPDADVIVLLTVPESSGPEWLDSESCRRARAMAGVRTVVDAEGVIARRLGMRTSGHVIAFDKAGRLAFSGGITLGRGQVGDSVGRRALASVAGASVAPGVDESPSTVTTPVFGCALVSPDECRDDQGRP